MEAESETEPVEVEPRLPCVAAWAVVAAATIASAATAPFRRLRRAIGNPYLNSSGMDASRRRPTTDGVNGLSMPLVWRGIRAINGAAARGRWSHCGGRV